MCELLLSLTSRTGRRQIDICFPSSPQEPYRRAGRLIDRARLERCGKEAIWPRNIRGAEELGDVMSEDKQAEARALAAIRALVGRPIGSPAAAPHPADQAHV